jgi:hypothetical protein
LRLIPLTQGYEAIVDDADYERASAHRWFASVQRNRKDGTIWNVYAVRTVVIDAKNTREHLHRFLLGVTDLSVLVDHINHDGLDNRRENIRCATYSQNNANSRKRAGTSSRFKGVHWSSRERKWLAEIRVNKKQKYLGLFSSEEAAAQAYAKAAGVAFGEFANV